jgi:hypothetical protein
MFHHSALAHPSNATRCDHVGVEFFRYGIFCLICWAMKVDVLWEPWVKDGENVMPSFDTFFPTFQILNSLWFVHLSSHSQRRHLYYDPAPQILETNRYAESPGPCIFFIDVHALYFSKSSYWFLQFSIREGHHHIITHQFTNSLLRPLSSPYCWIRHAPQSSEYSLFQTMWTHLMLSTPSPLR